MLKTQNRTHLDDLLYLIQNSEMHFQRISEVKVSKFPFTWAIDLDVLYGEALLAHYAYSLYLEGEWPLEGEPTSQRGVQAFKIEDMKNCEMMPFKHLGDSRLQPLKFSYLKSDGNYTPLICHSVGHHVWLTQALLQAAYLRATQVQDGHGESLAETLDSWMGTEWRSRPGVVLKAWVTYWNQLLS